MPTPEQTLTVSGSVTLPTGAPAINASVSASDRDMRSEQLLAETSTGSRGSYTLTYTSSQFRRVEIVKLLTINIERVKYNYNIIKTQI